MCHFIKTVSFTVLCLCVLCGFSHAAVVSIDSATNWTAPGVATGDTLNINAELKLSFGSVWYLNGQTINLNSGGTLVYNNDSNSPNGLGINYSGAIPTINFNGGTIRVDKTPGYTVSNVMIATVNGNIKTTLNVGGLTIDVAEGKRGSIVAHINDNPTAGGTTGTLTKTGEGTLVLYRPFYTSETILQGGTLRIQAPETGCLTGGIAMQGGTLENIPSIPGTPNPSSDTYQINSVTAGTNKLVGSFKAPATGLTVSGSTTSLAVGDSSNAASLTFPSGAALTISDGASVSLTSSSNASTYNIEGKLTLAFAGLWNVSGMTFNLNEGGTLHFTGKGTSTGAPALTNSGTINLNGGTILVDANPQNWSTDPTNRTFIASSSNTMKVYVEAGGATIQVDNIPAAGSTPEKAVTGRIAATMSNATGVTNPGAITKTGTGTLVLYSPEYTSETILQGGTLEIDAAKTGKLPGGVSLQGGTLVNSATINDKYLINGVSAGTNTVLGNFKICEDPGITVTTPTGKAQTVLNIGNETKAGNIEGTKSTTTKKSNIEVTNASVNLVNGTVSPTRLRFYEGSNLNIEANGKLNVMNLTLDASKGTITSTQSNKAAYVIVKNGGSLTATGTQMTMDNGLLVDGGTVTLTGGTWTGKGMNANDGSKPDSFTVTNKGSLTIDGAKVSSTQAVRIGLVADGGLLTLNSGSVTVAPTYGTAGAVGSLIVGGNGGGSAVINGGTFDVQGGSLLVGWYPTGDCSLTINGGTVKSPRGLTFGAKDGTKTVATTININGGNLAVNTLGRYTGYDIPGTMNITGNAITWSNYAGDGNIGTFETSSIQALNMTVTSGGFSTITANTVNLQGKVTAHYAGGIGAFTTVPDLVKGVNSFSSSTPTMTSNIFDVSKGSKVLTLTMKGTTAAYTQEPMVGYDGFLKLTTPSASGWFTTPGENIYDLRFAVNLDGATEEAFEKWLNEETSFAHGADYDSETKTLTLGSLPMLGAGKTFVWDFTGFKAGTATLTGIAYNVPEPATWALLLLGLLGIVGLRTKKRIMNNE